MYTFTCWQMGISRTKRTSWLQVIANLVNLVNQSLSFRVFVVFFFRKGSECAECRVSRTITNCVSGSHIFGAIWYKWTKTVSSASQARILVYMCGCPSRVSVEGARMDITLNVKALRFDTLRPCSTHTHTHKTQRDAF